LFTVIDELTINSSGAAVAIKNGSFLHFLQVLYQTTFIVSHYYHRNKNAIYLHKTELLFSGR